MKQGEPGEFFHSFGKSLTGKWEPRRHLGRSPVGPRKIRNEANVYWLGSCRLKLAIELPIPIGGAPRESLAFQNDDPVEKISVVSGDEIDVGRDKNVAN